MDFSEQGEASQDEAGRNPFGIPPIRLDWHRFQRPFDLTGFHKHSIRAQLCQPPTQSLRQRLSFKTNRCDTATQTAQPTDQYLRIARGLGLLDDLTMLADHADCGLRERCI
ncbi:hypothetical protein [Ruegeria sp. Ofav3-42]|uniref:hypothetical protein n=1 Tax=Ruegeria sp. Ofav3-42 TaxID=2917759 RepID=UPI00351D3D46